MLKANPIQWNLRSLRTIGEARRIFEETTEWFYNSNNTENVSRGAKMRFSNAIMEFSFLTRTKSPASNFFSQYTKPWSFFTYSSFKIPRSKRMDKIDRAYFP